MCHQQDSAAVPCVSQDVPITREKEFPFGTHAQD